MKHFLCDGLVCDLKRKLENIWYNHKKNILQACDFSASYFYHFLTHSDDKNNFRWRLGII